MEQAPKGLYVYQPHPVSKERGDRLYGVGGLPFTSRVDGFTKAEAEELKRTLERLGFGDA